MGVFITISVVATVVAGIVIGTLLIGSLLAWVSGDEESITFYAWLMSSIIAVFSVLSLLCENGVLE